MSARGREWSPQVLDVRSAAVRAREVQGAAAFVFGATLSVTACSSQVGGDTSASTGAGGATQDGGPDDDGGNVAHYGLPADSGPPDDGGGMALYGDPPPPDAGDDGGNVSDGGGPQPLYGAPPPPPKDV